MNKSLVSHKANKINIKETKMECACSVKIIQIHDLDQKKEFIMGLKSLFLHTDSGMINIPKNLYFVILVMER